MEKKKKKAAVRDVRGRGEVRKNLSSTRCSRRIYLCAYSEFYDGRDGVRVLRALRCLRR